MLGLAMLDKGTPGSRVEWEVLLSRWLVSCVFVFPGSFVALLLFTVKFSRMKPFAWTSAGIVVASWSACVGTDAMIELSTEGVI